MKKNTLLLTILLLLSFRIFAQELRWQESFETDGEGTRYTTSSIFNVSPNDHCQRTDGSDISNSSSSYSKIDGTYFWAAEDTDGGGDGLDEKSILFNPIDITGLTGLTFKGLFGADGQIFAGEWSFDPDDFISVEYSINGEAFQTTLSFRAGIDSNPFDGIGIALFRDADLDGIGDGIQLIPKLKEFSVVIPTGSSLQFRIRFQMDATSEEIAFDNFRLEVDALPEVELKVFLEGGFDSGSMTNNLVFGGILPTTQPYNNPPWNYTGNEVVSDGLYLNGIAFSIVDWVLVELRDKNNSSQVISRRAAFLKQDGTITDMDGTNNVRFSVPVNDYYITIYHRNHLPIMSSNPVSLSVP